MKGPHQKTCKLHSDVLNLLCITTKSYLVCGVVKYLAELCRSLVNIPTSVVVSLKLKHLVHAIGQCKTCGRNLRY